MKRIYIDNDIALKLAHWGVLDSVVLYSQEEDYELFTLQSLPYLARAYAGKRSETVEQEQFNKQIESLVSSSSELQLQFSTVEFLQNIEHPDLDSGELALIGAALDEAGCIATGDKRAVNAAHNLLDVSFQKLSGVGFLMLEQILKVVLSLGDDSKINQIKGCCAVDKAVELCFRSENKDEISQGLNSYITSMADNCSRFNFCETCKDVKQ